MRRLIILATLLGLGAAIAIAIGVQNNTRLSGIQIIPGGDYNLSVSQNGGTATLITGSAHAFHLEQDADANGQRIASVAPGAAPGEAFVYGQPISSADLTGQFPNVTLTNPRVSRSDDLPNEFLSPGACYIDDVPLAGAVVGGVAMVTAQGGSFGSGIIAAASVESAGIVRVRRCAVTGSPTALAVSVTVGFVP